MGQVDRSMQLPQGSMYNDAVRSNDTSTTSKSSENSTIHSHSADATSNIMLMDQYTHIMSSEIFVNSLPRYDGDDKRQNMDTTGKDDDDVCLQTVAGNNRDSGNMSKEPWNEYRPGLLHYPSLQTKIISPLPEIFHSLQLRDTDAHPLSTATTTTTADRIAALRSQYDIPFDSDKNDETVRAIHIAIDELAAMMNAHSILSDHTDNYAEEQHVEHSDQEDNTTTTTTTSASSFMNSSIPNSSTKSASLSPNDPALLSTGQVLLPQQLHTSSMESLSQRKNANTLPAEFQFSFANPCQESVGYDDQRTKTKEPHQPETIYQRKILPLPRPRVQRTQPQQSGPISSEFTFKLPYNASAHSKTGKNDIDSNKAFIMAKPDLYDMNHQTKYDETSQEFTKKAKRSGDCYTDDDDDDDEDGRSGVELVFRTYNRYSKTIGSSTATPSLPSFEMDKNGALDSQHSFLPPSLLQNSFLQPSPTGNNNTSLKPPSPTLQNASLKSPSPNLQNLSSKPSPPLSTSTPSKSKPIPSSSISPLPLTPPSLSQNKKNSKNRSSTPTFSPHTDSNRKNTTNNSNRLDTNRNTRGKQHGKQHSSPSLSSASTGRMTSTSRRKGKHGLADDLPYQYLGGGAGINDNNSLDLVTSTLVGPDDWICLFCQYEIFKKGWFTAKRKLLVQEQRKRIIQKRLEHRSTQQQQHTHHSLDQQQLIKDNGFDGDNEGNLDIAWLDASSVT